MDAKRLRCKTVRIVGEYDLIGKDRLVELNMIILSGRPRLLWLESQAVIADPTP